MSASLTKAWLWPVIAGVALALAALVGKVGWEGARALAFVDTHGAERGDSVLIPELGFAAAQSGAPAAPKAAARLRAIATGSEVGAPHARRALIAASSGSRSFMRPHTDVLAAIGAADTLQRAADRAPAPAPLWRLISVLALLGWWGATGVWIVKGNTAEGAATPTRRRAMLAALSCFACWLASVWWMV